MKSLNDKFGLMRKALHMGEGVEVPKGFGRVGLTFIPKVGDVFFSKYFGCKCVVISYVNDYDWNFAKLDSPHSIMKARSVPSQLYWENVEGKL